MGTFGGKGDFAMVGPQGIEDARRLTDVCMAGVVNLFDTSNMYSDGLSVLQGAPRPPRPTCC